jgi:hypothetical protein
MSINKPPISSMTIELINSLVGNQLAKSEKKPRHEMSVSFADPHGVAPTETEKDKNSPPSLTKSILNLLNGGRGDTIERLAFETDPGQNNTYQALYRNKLRLLPDTILKRIAIQDSLVAAIVNARSAQLQAFGRIQPDRHSTGFFIEPKKGILDKLSKEKKEEFQERIEKAERLLMTCGHTSNITTDDQMTFSQYLGMSTRNAVTVGRLATEIVYGLDPEDNEMKFHHFRPIDAGTIYAAAPYKASAESVRRNALSLLEQIKNKDFEPEKFKADAYSWIQVVEGTPRQAFTSNECLVHSFYPVSDIELDGYPLTPIDTAISDITTHINITTHNKLYFQAGRASRGMLIIQSEDVNEAVVQQIKQQFNASINSVANSWRMPCFGIGKDDQITWQPIDTGTRDMEFQYLSDSNARVILSAFQMSPEELPGYGHLSRGTNSQALSESNNEYKLEAARDVGIRPLVSNFEDFVNARIFPLIDKDLSKLCVIRFYGLDAETPEKESTRLQQDAPVHMVYDEVLQTVEKTPIGMEYGGEIPLNPMFQQLLDKYFSVGQVLERFCGVEGASKNPDLQYFRDPFWFQMQQLKQANQQMQMAQQQQAQQASQGGPPPGNEGQTPAGQGPQQDDSQGQSQPPEDLSRSIDQVMDLLTKSEADLPPSRRRLLQHHRKTVDTLIGSFKLDTDELAKEILDVAEDFLPKTK